MRDTLSYAMLCLMTHIHLLKKIKANQYILDQYFQLSAQDSRQLEFLLKTEGDSLFTDILRFD